MTNKQYVIETPVSHPHHVFETRLLTCLNSNVVYCVTFPKMYWKRFERTNPTEKSQNRVISSCFKISLKADLSDLTQPNFSDILHYWINVSIKREKEEKEGRIAMLFNGFSSRGKIT